jgi:hypothetical protein
MRWGHMTSEDIRKLYWNEPFAPFQLVLKGGREILVAKREYISIAVTGDRLAFASKIEDFEIIEMTDVAGVRLFGPPSQSVLTPQNGAA